MVMRAIFAVLISLLLTSCDRSSEAIQLTQQSKAAISEAGLPLLQVMQMRLSKGLQSDLTWQDVANSYAENDPEKKYSWSASEANEDDVYVTNFRDQDGWGLSWEVDIKNKTVKFINSNEFLSMKYGHTTIDQSSPFVLDNMPTPPLHEAPAIHCNDISGFKCVIEGNLKNTTDSKITRAEVSLLIKVIYPEKVIKAVNTGRSGFMRQVSVANPWNPSEEIAFKLESNEIDKIYDQYKPNYVVAIIHLSAEDPVGYSYDKDIAQIDLQRHWESEAGMAKNK